METTPDQKLEAAGVILKSEIEWRDARIQEYEEAIINMFGLLRVLTPAEEGKLTSHKELIKKIAPLSIKINERIRTDAVERVIAYLNGKGYVFDAKTVEELKAVSFRFRRVNYGNAGTTSSTDKTN